MCNKNQQLPVLSLHITLTQPRVSTVGSFFTMAFLLAIRITPKANVTVTTIGKPEINIIINVI